jgi:hypothetical protein
MTSKFECEDVLEMMVVFLPSIVFVNIALKEEMETRSAMFLVNYHKT